MVKNVLKIIQYVDSPTLGESTEQLRQYNGHPVG
jgi:hypothetical protein